MKDTDTQGSASTSTFNMDGGNIKNQQTNQTYSQPAQPTQNTGSTGGQRMSFREAAAIASSPMGENAGSELVSTVIEKLSKIYERFEDLYQIKILPLDNNQYTNLALSAVVVCVQNKRKRQVGVAFYTMILEGTAPPILPRYENINGKQVEILRPTSVAWDYRLFDTVKSAVADAFPNLKLLTADGMVVPRNFNVDFEKDVYRLARNALHAATNEIDTNTPGFNDLNLANVTEKSNFVTSLKFEDTNISGDDGLPMRSDIQIEVVDNLGNNQQDNSSVHSNNRSTRVGAMSGFVDFSWAPVIQNTGYANTYAPTQQLPPGFLPTQKYAARYVITQIDPSALATLPALLFLIASAPAVAENNNWIRSYHKRGKTMHDIGGLNIEANILNDASGKGAKIDTTADSFTLHDTAQLINAMVRPGISIAIDIPDCGPQTWYSSVLATAATGSGDATSAEQIIVNAANHLTNNAFSRFFQPGTPVFVDTNNRVHLGYFSKSGGAIEDIRAIDYLAVLNMRGATDDRIVRNWSDSFTFTQASIQERLDVRARIIRELAPNAVFTGFATRATFSSEFLNALANGIANCGIRQAIQTNGVGAFMADRGIAAFTNSGIISGQNHLFSHAAPQMNAQYYNHNGFQGRFI